MTDTPNSTAQDAVRPFALRRDPGLWLFLLPGALLGLASAVFLSLAVPRSPGPVTGLSLDLDGLDQVRAELDLPAYSLANLRREGGPVPALFLERLPGDWAELEDSDERKRLFFKSVLPLVLQANAAVLAERGRLEPILAAPPAERSPDDVAWLTLLAERYGMERPRTPAQAARLLRRVDAVPVSLALAQAANESGWGRARFTHEGNALFGQWTWDESEGVVPRDRPEGEGYAVRAFGNLGESVAGYLHNLNVHPAYAGFRRLRAQQRAAAAPLDSLALDGLALAGTLTAYSERGEDYVAELRAMIRHNALDAFDRGGLHLVEELPEAAAGGTAPDAPAGGAAAD